MAHHADRTIPPDWSEDIDTAIFEQILEMDEDDDDSMEFSRGIVFDFLDQADATFERMDSNLEKGDLDALSRDGHFLKGSSATLGYTRIKDACEKIQNYGKKQTADGTGEIKEEVALEKIRECIQEARDAYRTIKFLMRRYYDD